MFYYFKSENRFVYHQIHYFVNADLGLGLHRHKLSWWFHKLTLTLTLTELTEPKCMTSVTTNYNNLIELTVNFVLLD